MYFMIVSQRKFIRSCQVLFGSRQCYDTAKFLFRITQWSTFIQWRHNSHYIGSRLRQRIVNLTILRKNLYLSIYNKTQVWRSFFRILVLTTDTLLEITIFKKNLLAVNINLNKYFDKRILFYIGKKWQYL